jgi:hypothetical protein
MYERPRTTKLLRSFYPNTYIPSKLPTIKKPDLRNGGVWGGKRGRREKRE